MAAGQRPNFPYNLFQVGDYVGNPPSFLVRKTVRRSDRNQLLIPGEARDFFTYPSPNFNLDELRNTGSPVLVRTTAGNINCVVKQRSDSRCMMIVGWPQLRDALGLGVDSEINIFGYHAPTQMVLVIVPDGQGAAVGAAGGVGGAAAGAAGGGAGED